MSDNNELASQAVDLTAAKAGVSLDSGQREEFVGILKPVSAGTLTSYIENLNGVQPTTDGETLKNWLTEAATAAIKSQNPWDMNAQGPFTQAGQKLAAILENQHSPEHSAAPQQPAPVVAAAKPPPPKKPHVKKPHVKKKGDAPPAKPSPPAAPPPDAGAKPIEAAVAPPAPTTPPPFTGKRGIDAPVDPVSPDPIPPPVAKVEASPPSTPAAPVAPSPDAGAKSAAEPVKPAAPAPVEEAHTPAKPIEAAVMPPAPPPAPATPPQYTGERGIAAPVNPVPNPIPPPVAKAEASPPPKPVAPATPQPVQTIPAVVHKADPEQNFGFASGKSGLSDAQKKQIAAWADAYKASGSREMISVSGHADTVGNPARNKALSAKRAQAVADCLKENGIDPARIRTAAYGSDPAHLPHKTVGPVSDASNRCARLTMGDHAQPSQTFARERPAQRPRNRIIFDDLHPATNKAAEANKTPPMQTAKADSKSPRLQAPSA